MRNNLPLGRLGEVLTKSEDWICVKPENRYKQVTVRLWGKGVTQRNEVSGTEISAEKRIIIHSQQFILSRIDARNGAFGIVPKSLDGALVSSDFPVFDLNLSKIVPGFLEWLSKTQNFIEICKAASEGTTNRVRLKGDSFLASEIPLPSLDEQRRIVARIGELAARIEEARELRRRAAKETEVFWKQSIADLFIPIEKISITVEDVCEDIIDNLHSTPKYDGDDYPCIRSQDVGWGTINYSTALRTSEEEFLERIRRGEPRKGDIVYVREGDVGRCAVVDGSQRFSLGQRVMMFRPDDRKVDSRFLMLQLVSPPVLRDQVLSGMTGTTSHHVNIKHIRKVKINLPPLLEQRRVVAHLDALQSKLDALKRHQAETAAELDALMPAVLERAFRGEL